MDRLRNTIIMFNRLGNKMILNSINKCDNINCKECIDYMNCFMNQIGIGSGNFGKECSFYNVGKW
jgi:hypothetical protein